MDVIILSGGLGKRLRSIVKDIPKTMAKVNERPFLEHTLKYISQFDVQNVILAVGYKREYIKKYFELIIYNQLLKNLKNIIRIY